MVWRDLCPTSHGAICLGAGKRGFPSFLSFLERACSTVGLTPSTQPGAQGLPELHPGQPGRQALLLSLACVFASWRQFSEQPCSPAIRWMVPRPTCGSLPSLGVEGGVHGGCWSPLALLGQLPCSVLVVSDVGRLCQPPREAPRHWSFDYLLNQAERGLCCKCRGGWVTSHLQASGSIMPAMGCGCIWRGECRLGFSLLRSVWTLGGRGRWPASPKLRRSLGATLGRGSRRRFGRPLWFINSVLTWVSPGDMCYRNGGPSLAWPV